MIQSPKAHPNHLDTFYVCIQTCLLAIRVQTYYNTPTKLHYIRMELVSVRCQTSWSHGEIKWIYQNIESFRWYWKWESFKQRIFKSSCIVNIIAADDSVTSIARGHAVNWHTVCLLPIYKPSFINNHTTLSHTSFQIIFTYLFDISNR